MGIASAFAPSGFGGQVAPPILRAHCGRFGFKSVRIGVMYRLTVPPNETGARLVSDATASGLRSTTREWPLYVGYASGLNGELLYSMTKRPRLTDCGDCKVNRAKFPRYRCDAHVICTIVWVPGAKTAPPPNLLFALSNSCSSWIRKLLVLPWSDFRVTFIVRQI